MCACTPNSTQVGVRLALEKETNKWFPASNDATEVRDRLVRACTKLGVTFAYGAGLQDLQPLGGSSSSSSGDGVSSSGDSGGSGSGGDSSSRDSSGGSGDWPPSLERWRWAVATIESRAFGVKVCGATPYI